MQQKKIDVISFLRLIKTMFSWIVLTELEELKNQLFIRHLKVAIFVDYISGLSYKTKLSETQASLWNRFFEEIFEDKARLTKQKYNFKVCLSKFCTS